MNLTAYLGVNIENWQKGWKQAEGQSDAAFSKITAQMEKTEKSIKSLENSMKSGRERLSERLQNMGATAEQQSAILSRYDYSQKLKEQIAQTCRGRSMMPTTCAAASRGSRSRNSSPTVWVFYAHTIEISHAVRCAGFSIPYKKRAPFPDALVVKRRVCANKVVPFHFYAEMLLHEVDG